MIEAPQFALPESMLAGLPVGYVPPPIPYWLKNTLPDPGYRIQFLKKNGDIHWQAYPGPQTWTLLCPYDEILLGGARGGGKSQALIAWFAMGDMSLPEGDPARYSFLNDPSFRGLILRDEYASMAEFVDEATDFFRPFEGKAKDDPAVFHFKSGAKIYTNHLGNKDAYNKYRGWGLTKIGIEEMTQIPQQGWYTKLFGALRGKKQIRVYNRKQYPKLRNQILGTTNPDGPGAAWVKSRFVEVQGGGKMIPWNTPMLDSITSLKRIFIPAQLKDNPSLKDDRQYMGMLLSQDEVTQAQWIHGDWNAGSGVYFRDYRPDGPRGIEEADKYPQASHRILSADLKPWWFRWGGGDWGYQHNAVFHKYCRNESDKRVHVYDELAVRQIGSFELGVMLAKWWMPELEALPDHQITIALSPDAFSKTDATKTKAEQMEAGIQQVLGPYGAILLRYNESEREAMLRDPKQAAAMFEQRKLNLRGKMCIALQPANNNRVDGWDYVRDMLRFRPALVEIESDPNYLKHILETRGIEAYEREASEIRERKPEVLPKIQLWRVCASADAFLKAAMHDEPPRAEDVRKFDAEDGVGGDDGGDALRYGLMHYKAIETVIPKAYWVNERMSQIQEVVVGNFGAPITDVNRLVQMQRTQAALYNKTQRPSGGSMILPRHASMRHRIQ